jgi:hypothetical protein
VAADAAPELDRCVDGAALDVRRARARRRSPQTGAASRRASEVRVAGGAGRGYNRRVAIAPTHQQIRADFDRDSVVVYQAFNDAIADAALAAQRLVPPFSYGRMTWIKPSFLWLMERSAWAKRPNQTRILGVRIAREAWDGALESAVLTAFVPTIHGDRGRWQREFDAAPVRVQWDPERSLRGAKLQHRSIQVGLARAVAEDYANRWVVEIRDLTPLTKKIRALVDAGQHGRAGKHLPREAAYPATQAARRRLAIT